MKGFKFDSALEVMAYFYTHHKIKYEGVVYKYGDAGININFKLRGANRCHFQVDLEKEFKEFSALGGDIVFKSAFDVIAYVYLHRCIVWNGELLDLNCTLRFHRDGEFLDVESNLAGFGY